MTKKIKSIHKNYTQHGIDSTPPCILNHSLLIFTQDNDLILIFGCSGFGGAASMPKPLCFMAWATLRN